MTTNKKLELLHDEDEFENDEQMEIYADKMLSAMEQGATVKDMYSISNDTMQDLYEVAYDFYYKGKLDDAESLFRILCIYDFYNPEYPIGLGAVYQLKNNYAKAIDFYALAYSLSKDDYRPMFYAGECNVMLRQGVQARRCFEIVIERCKDESLIEKSKSYLSALDSISNDENDTTIENQNNEE